MKNIEEIALSKNFTEKERNAYEDRLKWLMIEANTLKKAEEKGEVKGRAEGRVEGIEIGEKQKAIKIAKSLIIRGIDIDIISDSTDLPIEEIEKLKAELEKSKE